MMERCNSLSAYMEDWHMKIAVIILVAATAVLLILFVAGAVAANSAEEEFYREFDDREQTEYLRRWREKKNRKRRH